MVKINVVNIKCGGCAKTIENELTKLGCSQIKVNINTQEIICVGKDKKLVIEKLSKLGYPEASSPEAISSMKKARSFVSCAMGKMKK